MNNQFCLGSAGKNIWRAFNQGLEGNCQVIWHGENTQCGRRKDILDEM